MWNIISATVLEPLLLAQWRAYAPKGRWTLLMAASHHERRQSTHSCRWQQAKIGHLRLEVQDRVKK